MTTYPDLFILGPPRTGTTSLARWLDQHPSIAIAATKETGHFLTDLQLPGRIDDAQAYLRLFNNSAELRGEATPWYLFDPGAAKAIHAVAPTARLVVGLREPADMLASLHNHHVYVGIEREPDFERAVFGPGRPTDDHDFRVGVDYLAVGAIGTQIQRYLDLFGRSNISVVRFDELTANPQRSHLALLESLGCEPIALEEYHAYNPARHWRLKRHRSSPPRTVAHSNRVIRRVNGLIRSTASTRGFPPPPDHAMDRIRAELSAEVQLAESLLDVDLSAWR